MGQTSVSRPLGRPASLSRELADADAQHFSAARSPDVVDSPVVESFRGEKLATDLLIHVFSSFPGAIWLRLWAGAAFRVGAPDAVVEEGEPRFVIVFRNPRAVCATVLGRDPLRLAEFYFRGDLDIEGDFFAALGIKDHLETVRVSAGNRLGAIFSALRLRAMNFHAVNAEWARPATAAAALHGHTVRRHSRRENRAAIQFHYDVSNEFYALWLDRAMVYSCAYFERPDISLDDAQQAKLEHICRKLMLKPGERFLDIGCGWGALVIYAAQHYGVRARGITLSKQQLTIARKRVQEANLEDRVTVDLLDYRDLPEDSAYDKVASVGMFEHVGLKNLPTYFSTVHRLLKPVGLFLNHGITHQQAGSSNVLPTEFINRYVFPDGQLDSISGIQRVMESSHFEIADVEGLRPHYALTLRDWVQRLERRHARALEYVNEATYRVWRLYMAACALEFESGAIGVYQVLASKRAATNPELPLTRRHLYSEPSVGV
jgi:cyclopropane-fatty-acyl-phospholipid synthase